MTEIPYHKQFIIYYPPGLTVLNQGIVDNADIARDILQALHEGKCINFMRLEGWRIAQRRENGQFEEIFPDKPIEQKQNTIDKNFVVCNKCGTIQKRDTSNEGIDDNMMVYTWCNVCSSKIIIEGA